MALKYRITAEGGDRMCRTCESFDGKEFYMVEFEEGVNAPPFHPNCRCEYEVFETDDVVNKPLANAWEYRIPLSQIKEEYIKIASTLASFEQIKEENYKIRSEITRSSPNYSQTVVGGESYGRALSGTEIINWVTKNGIRVSNGKDYSGARRIGVGFSKFDIDIKSEYEKYKKSESNPVSYETFANICAPYWDADIKADIRAKRDELFENVVTALSLTTIIYSGMSAGKIDISLPRINSGGLSLNAAGVGVIGKLPAIEGKLAISGSIDVSVVNAGLLERLAAASDEQINNFLYQVFGEGDSGGAGSGSGGNGNVSSSSNEDAGKTVDDIIQETTETTQKAGIARNFEKSGGYSQTINDFESLNPSRVKDIQTRFGPGKVGTLNDGSTVIARPGSTSGGGSTLEVQISNSKVYKIRYGD